jgi:hypothetical protein
VRGFEWESLLLVGKKGRPQVVAMTWWGREKGVEGQQRQQQERLLARAARQWGDKVCHVFDRGYGTGPWLSRLSRFRVRFVVRWKKGNKLLDDAGGERKAWEIARGQRSWGTEAKLLWDTHVRVYRSTRVLALPVRHPEYQGRLWLVVVRQGKGREPWYLLTNEPVENEEQAWEIAFSYVSRWKIEDQFRFHKTELLIESLRLRDWEPRRKLLLLVTLAYGFLLWVLAPRLFLARSRLLVRLQATRRLAAVERQTSCLSAPLGAQSALALPSSLLRGIWLAALSSPLPPHLAALFITLVDDSVASVRISVLKLCFGS